MTNEQLKRIIQKIEVDKDGNVDIYLRLFGDLGLDETVLISDNETQRRNRAITADQSGAGKRSEESAGCEQIGTPYQRRPGDKRKVFTSDEKRNKIGM